jgi:hypothetical protein
LLSSLSSLSFNLWPRTALIISKYVNLWEMRYLIYYVYVNNTIYILL